jgi:hypothetical protein
MTPALYPLLHELMLSVVKSCVFEVFALKFFFSVICTTALAYYNSSAVVVHKCSDRRKRPFEAPN